MTKKQIILVITLTVVVVVAGGIFWYLNKIKADMENEPITQGYLNQKTDQTMTAEERFVFDQTFGNYIFNGL